MKEHNDSVYFLCSSSSSEKEDDKKDDKKVNFSLISYDKTYLDAGEFLEPEECSPPYSREQRRWELGVSSSSSSSSYETASPSLATSLEYSLIFIGQEDGTLQVFDFKGKSYNVRPCYKERGYHSFWQESSKIWLWRENSYVDEFDFKTWIRHVVLDLPEEEGF